MQHDESDDTSPYGVCIEKNQIKSISSKYQRKIHLKAVSEKNFSIKTILSQYYLYEAILSGTTAKYWNEILFQYWVLTF